MSQSQASSVIRSLETVRERAKQRLMKLPEYRAFLAIEQPIAEVADISDLVVHLQAAKQKILERLATTREYQALLTVEKAINDISEVLDVVAEDGNVDAAPASAESPSGKKELTEVTAASAAVVTELPETYPRNAAELAAAEKRPETPVSSPTERLSTLGLVEEPRLTAMVRDSFAANRANEEARPEGTAETEKAKVA